MRKIVVWIQILGLIILRPLKVVLRIFFIKKIFLKEWSGQLGNNLLQLARTEFLAAKIEASISLPIHQFLDLEQHYRLHTALIDPPGIGASSTFNFFLADLRHFGKPTINLEESLLRNFYYQYDSYPYSLSLWNWRETLREKILPLLPSQLDPRITDETLVIHIRSGDIFQTDWAAHAAYVQPPMSFYLEIIEAFNFQDIVIVTQQDLKNPCIHKLQQQFPRIRIQASSLVEDISTILSARNLVTGQSTFSLALGFASSQIQHLYIPQFDLKQGYIKSFLWSDVVKLTFQANYQQQFKDLDFEIHLAKISQYISIGDWHNSPEQRDLMLNHKREHVTLLK